MLKPIVTQYRKDGWKILLKAALHLALKCAFLEAAIPDYVAFGLELGTIHILRKHLYGEEGPATLFTSEISGVFQLYLNTKSTIGALNNFCNLCTEMVQISFSWY